MKFHTIFYFLTVSIEFIVDYKSLHLGFLVWSNLGWLINAKSIVCIYLWLSLKLSFIYFLSSFYQQTWGFACLHICLIMVLWNNICLCLHLATKLNGVFIFIFFSIRHQGIMFVFILVLLCFYGIMFNFIILTWLKLRLIKSLSSFCQ